MKRTIIERSPTVEILFSRNGSIAAAIAKLIDGAEDSIDAALYSVNNPDLFAVLEQAHRRGVRVRLLSDWSKYRQNDTTRGLLADASFPCRLLRGRDGDDSKMHHKFLLLDDSTVLTGSYNWTSASESQHYENVQILRDPEAVRSFAEEFSLLWEDGAKPPKS